MLAFDLLGVDFADSVASGRQMAFIDSSRIRVKVDNAKGLEQDL
jgi:hypothetical protein